MKTTKYELVIDGTVLPPGGEVRIEANMVKFVKAVLRRKPNQAPVPSAEDVVIRTRGVAKIDPIEGKIVPNGVFTFLIGPDNRKGDVECTIEVEDRLVQTFSVRFF